MGQYKFHTQKAAYLWGIIARRIANGPPIAYFDRQTGFLDVDLDNTEDFFDKALTQCCVEYVDANKADPFVVALGAGPLEDLVKLSLKDLLKTGKDAIIGIDAYVKASAKGSIAMVSDGCAAGLAKLFTGLIDPVKPQTPDKNSALVNSVSARLGAKLIPKLESFVVKQEVMATGQKDLTKALWALDRAWGFSDPDPGVTNIGLSLAEIEKKLNSLGDLDALLGKLKFNKSDGLTKARNSLTKALADLAIAFDSLNSDFTSSSKGMDPKKPKSLDKFAIQMMSFIGALSSIRDQCSFDGNYLSFKDVVDGSIRETYEGIAHVTVARVQTCVATANKALAPKFWPVDTRNATSSSKSSFVPWSESSTVAETPETRPTEWFSDPSKPPEGGGKGPER